jgi:hypothetical protein
MMDWFIIHYLIKNKVTSDESINNLTIYLNTISNYIAKFYETQSVRSNMMTELTTEKQDDRYNKARGLSVMMMCGFASKISLRRKFSFDEEMEETNRKFQRSGAIC